VVDTAAQQEALHVAVGAVHMQARAHGATPLKSNQAGALAAPLFPELSTAAHVVDFDVAVGSVQMDNMWPGSTCPVVLSQLSDQGGHFASVRGSAAFSSEVDNGTGGGPTLQLGIRVDPLHVAIDTQLIMLVLSEDSPWNDVLMGGADTRATFRQLVPAAEISWRPPVLCLVQRLQLQPLELYLTVTKNPALPLDGDAIKKLLPSCPGVLRAIVSLIFRTGHSWSLSQFPLSTRAYEKENVTTCASTLATGLGTAVGDQISAATEQMFAGVRQGVMSAKDYVKARLRSIASSSGQHVRPPRPVLASSPLEALDSAVLDECLRRLTK